MNIPQTDCCKSSLCVAILQSLSHSQRRRNVSSRTSDRPVVIELLFYSSKLILIELGGPTGFYTGN